jgi:hypothetical protein
MKDRITSILLAIFPFIPLSIGVAIYRYGHNWQLNAWVSFAGLFLMLALLVVAWVKDFPRWSYPYAVLIGLICFAFVVGRDSDMTFKENLIFKTVGLSPFVLLFGLLWLFTRHLRPLPHFFARMRQDGTLFSLCVYSLLPLVILTIFTDFRTSQAAPFLAAATLVSAAGAGLFFLLSQPRQRLALLGICLTLCWGTIALSKASLADTFQIDTQHVIAWAVMLGLLCAPLLLRSFRSNLAR